MRSISSTCKMITQKYSGKVDLWRDFRHCSELAIFCSLTYAHALIARHHSIDLVDTAAILISIVSKDIMGCSGENTY